METEIEYILDDLLWDEIDLSDALNEIEDIILDKQEDAYEKGYEDGYSDGEYDSQLEL